MQQGGWIKAFLFEDFTFANDGGEMVAAQNGPFTLPDNATASIKPGAEFSRIVISDDDDMFDDGFQDANDGTLNQILSQNVSTTNADGDPVNIASGRVLEVEFTLTATPEGGGESFDLLFVAAGPGENAGDLTFVVSTGPLDPDTTYNISFKNDGGGARYSALEDGVVDGEETGELMTPGYDDADGATDDGGDEIDGDDGVDDVILGNGGNDTIDAGLGNDTVDGGDDNDDIDGNDGDDVISGGAGDDTIDGGRGADSIDAGDGTDLVRGGAGNDTIRGGGENDTLDGGAGADTIIIDQLGSSGGNTTTVDGGSDGNDSDTLDVMPLREDGWRVTSFTRVAETNGNPGFNGQIQFQRGAETAVVNYSDIERLVVCFTPDARIITPGGARPVETLRPGDKVVTRDNGLREIRWVGRRDLSAPELAQAAEFQPILIRKHALGPGMPERDMLVSPNHRMLLCDALAEVMFGEREVLVAAKHLTGLTGVDRAMTPGVSYIHLMFDHHELILADGAWSESFQPGDYSLRGVGAETRDEIVSLFPDLATATGLDAYRAARLSLRANEARLLVRELY